MRTSTDMRTFIPPTPGIAALLLWIAASNYAAAFYEPTVQRWLNRDPLADLAFRDPKQATLSRPSLDDFTSIERKAIGGVVSVTTRIAEMLPEGPNLYAFVGNGPPEAIDPFGLDQKKLKACLKACEGGSDAIERFCRCLRHPGLKAGCWAVVFLGENACKGYCYWNFSD